MVAYLLDTNVISELTRPEPNDGVLSFLTSNEDLWVPAIVVYELIYGIELLPEGRRREQLQATIDRFLNEYDDRIIPLTMTEAVSAAKIRSAMQSSGKALSLADSLVAGVAQAHDLTLATRNMRDFEGCDIAVINPFN